MRTLIVTGGDIDKNFLKEHLKMNKYDIIIAVDKGLESIEYCSLQPNYIVGDFDSVKNEILEKYKQSKSKIIQLNPEKDLTDTHTAINLATELKSDDITLIGAIGSRIDHTLANIHILKIAIENEIKIRIINQNNEITLIDKNIKIKKDEHYKYISLIPLTTKVEGVTLKGFKYLLNDDTLYIGDSLGVSNEQINEIAEIQIKKGILILIKSKD